MPLYRWPTRSLMSSTTIGMVMPRAVQQVLATAVRSFAVVGCLILISLLSLDGLRQPLVGWASRT